MQKYSFLYHRNRVFLLLYATGVGLFALFVCSERIDFFNKFPTIAIIFSIIMFFMQRSKISPHIQQVLLIAGGNFTVLLYNYQTYHYFGVLWFVLFYLLVTVYESMRINIIMAMTLITEILLLLVMAPLNLPNSEHQSLVALFLFMTLLIICISWSHLYIYKIGWRKMERLHKIKDVELQSRNAYLDLFFEHATDSIAVFDLDGYIIDVNPAFEKLYGWKRAEIIGKNPQLVPSENIAVARQRQLDLLNGKKYKLLQTQDMKKDGTCFDAQISLSPISDDKGNIIATSIISRDISYLKENEKLQIQSEKLKLAGELAAGVAHEIRNPMTVISGFVQMITNDKDTPYHSYSALIQSEIDRIDLIIGEFLVLSKPQANTYDTLNFYSIVEETASIMNIAFMQQGIILDTVYHTQQATILGDKNQLKQVIINISKNAIEALETSTKLKHITFTLNADDETVTLIIADNGVGMSPELITHICEPFYTTKAKGTGLGMIIVNKIIDDHRGKLSIASEVGIGTAISITLPLQH